MENKQTAVEWLMNKLTWEDEEDGGRYNSYLDYIDLKEYFIKAKEIEKEQIKKAYKDCHDLGYIYGLDLEEYYNETYGTPQ